MERSIKGRFGSYAESSASLIVQGPISAQPRRCSVPPPWRSAMGHEEQFSPTTLSAPYVIRQETFAGTHCNGRDAPSAAIRGRRRSTHLFEQILPGAPPIVVHVPAGGRGRAHRQLVVA